MGLDNGYKGIQIMDIKVFITNLIRFVLIFTYINMNCIMMKSFVEVS